MAEKGIQEKLTELLSPEISVMGFELIELDFSGGLLRLTIDKPSGVSLDDCVSVNRRVSMLLDTEDPIQGSYRLEVSSPGLTRRLKTLKDFEHFSGRKAKIVTKEGTYRGTIKGLAGDNVLLDSEGSELSFHVRDIVKANLDFDF
jgi:ribosome maturation factor RimP